MHWICCWQLSASKPQAHFAYHPKLAPRHVGELNAGESFGTYSCLLGEPRAATVIATTYCELYCLKRSDLEDVISQWPELADEFQSLGEW